MMKWLLINICNTQLNDYFMTMYCVVEFHGFRDSRDGWIVKELSIVGSMITFNIIFKSPYPKDCITCRKTRRSITWLERNYHKVLWEEGTVPFKHDLVYMLLKPFDTVYTKGLEKKEFLDQFHIDVREIEENASADDPKTVCCCLPQHKNNKKCALKSATMYYNFLTKKIKSM